MGEFKNFKTSFVGNALPAYSWMLSIIESFNVDPERFFPQLYKAFSSKENLCKALVLTVVSSLVFEVANHVLAHFTGATIEEDVVTFHTEETENFSEKDLSLTSYLVGYVFETFYRRLRCCAKNISLYSHQFLSFLYIGNCVGENDTFPKHKHVDIMHTGVLWKIN